MFDETTYIGKQIGNYQIISEIARGSFGSVYLAQHIFLTDRNVAIKLLHTTHLNSKEESGRFLQEARFLETLKHPYILPILDVGIYERLPYLVTEYAPNGSLRDLIDRYHPQAMPQAEALTILSQVGQALHHAHQQHIIHRDLKPENILFSAKGDALLADFGIATMLATTAQQPENNIGTPSYMAPEHFKGTVSKESDQYALGCIAYEVFTGRKAFNTTNFFSLGFQHLTEPPLAPTQLNPSLPLHSEQAILKAMAKERADRFPDIPAFIHALHAPPAMQRNISTKDPGLGKTNFSAKVDTVQLPLTPLPPLPGITPLHEVVAKDKPAASAAPGRGLSDMPTSLHIPSGRGTRLLDFATPENAPTERFTVSPLTDIEQPGIVTGSIPTPGKEVATGSLKAAHAARPTQNQQFGTADNSYPQLFKKRGFYIAAVFALVILVAGGGILYALPALLRPAATSPTNTTSLSTVTITPASKDLKNNYTISAVTGVPNAAQHQVQARFLSSTTQPQSKTVNATGTKTQQATQATGTLIIENFNNTTLDLFSGTTIPQSGKNSSIQLQLNANVTVPPLNPKTQRPGTESASAHVVQAGTVGNLAARAICSYCNNNSVSWDAYNPAPFSGGQNSQTYTAVQQSDLDSVANPLKASLLQSAQTMFQEQIHANEQLVSSAQCALNVTSNPALGDKATTVSVTVSASCTGEVYDQQGAKSMAATLLKNDATASSYVPRGQIATTITQATLSSTQPGVVLVSVNAEDMAEYQFSNTQKQALAKLIAGKSEQEAQALLLKQPGISNVTISLVQGKIEPTDAGEIMITIA